MVDGMEQVVKAMDLEAVKGWVRVGKEVVVKAAVMVALVETVASSQRKWRRVFA